MKISTLKLKGIRELCQCDDSYQCEPCGRVFQANYELESVQDNFLDSLTRITRDKAQKENDIVQDLMKDLRILPQNTLQVGGGFIGATE